jgi:pSer/pThr/pTyr-binding forkhead associated (FHA) protein
MITRTLEIPERGGMRMLLAETGLIGRSSDCDCRIHWPTVSRIHCRYRVEGEILIIVDAGSKTGIYAVDADGEINPERAERIELRPGEMFALGDVFLLRYTVRAE